jgi:hypothetical protein
MEDKQHTWVEHENCKKPYCEICEGGLSICSICGLIEGSLTTECPGYRCWTEKGDDIYAGKIDFRNGQWVKECSPYSPAFYAQGN